MATPKPAAKRTPRAKSPPPAAPAAAPTGRLADPLTNLLTMLPLNRLILSGLNVRRTARDADIAALAEDIAARGLKQNLVVVPAHFLTGEDKADWADKFEVIAGGRRYQALQLLADAGRIAADHPVSVLVEDRDEATETSLSENLHRVAMNPADEFLAFDAIVARARDQLREPDPVAYCAQRFGVTRRHVEGRLRLAALAPDILDALRTDTITLDAAKAYAGTADHELQLQVFADQCKPGAWKPHDPQSVRSALRGATLPVSSPLVTYVTLDAYRAAGGRTEFEMFMGSDGDERIIDVTLLQDMAHARAERECGQWLAANPDWASTLLARGVAPAARLPAAPTGFARDWSWYGDHPDEGNTDHSGCIAVLAIAVDGSGLIPVARFKPEQPRAAAAPSWTAPTEEERAAQAREDGTLLWAARLAVGPFAGTPLDGKAFWPLTKRWVEDIAIEYASEDPHDHTIDHAHVAILVRVEAADIAAMREAGQARYDELLAQRQAASAAARAEQDADDDDDDADEDDAGDWEE